MAKVRVQQPLVVDELIIREYTMDDLDVLDHAITHNRLYLLPWIGPWIESEPIGIERRRELLQQWIAEYPEMGADHPIGIFCGDQLVGSTGLHDRNEPNDVEIGYWVDEEWQGRGIATRVTKALTDYAFRFPHVDRVVLKHRPDNLKSRRIPEKLGYVQLAELSDCGCGDGDHTNWGVTREQWWAREGIDL